MMKSRFTPMVFLFSIILFIPVLVQAGVPLEADGTIPGKPFQVLQDQIDAIELTPGPPGPEGSPGPPAVVRVLAEPQGEDGNHLIGNSLYSVQDVCGQIGGLPFEAGIFDNLNSPELIIVEIVGFVQFALDVQFKITRLGESPLPGDVVNAPVEFYVRCLDPNTPVNPVVITQTPKLVFVSSLFVQANLGGLAGADTQCTNEAHINGLTGTYKAWLSSDPNNTPARDSREAREGTNWSMALQLQPAGGILQTDPLERRSE